MDATLGFLEISILIYLSFMLNSIVWVPGLPFPSLIYFFTFEKSPGNFLRLDVEVPAKVFVQASFLIDSLAGYEILEWKSFLSESQRPGSTVF